MTQMMAWQKLSQFKYYQYQTLICFTMILLNPSKLTKLHADFVNLSPNTVGYYTADPNFAWNDTTSMGQISSTTLIGSTQGLLANKEHRTYMIFDTFQANSGILSASINIGISWWTNSRGGLPSVPNFKLWVGQPQGFSAADFASPHPMYSDSGRLLFDALSDNSLGNVTVNAAPNTTGFGSVIWYTVNLPLSFVAKFNQAQTGGARYVTLSLTADNAYINKAEITQVSPNGSYLRVNTFSSVPEPFSVVSLGLGIAFAVAGSRRNYC
jgi:hypothetical protein